MMKRLLPGALAALGLLTTPGVAEANGFEFPSNGTESFGRGSAWLARATDPLATFYNPAALARNGNAASVSTNLIWQKACFQRRDGGSDPVANGVTVGTQDQLYGQTCNDGNVFPNPQIALQLRLTDRLGIGVAVMGPSAYGKTSYPTLSTNTSLATTTFGSPAQGPSGGRFVLTNVDNLLIWPQIAVGYEVARNIRVGGSFIWGLASLEFGNTALGLVNGQTRNAVTGRINEDGLNDVGTKVKARDWFVPGFVLSALATVVDTPSSGVDVAGWFHWSDAIRGRGKTELTTFLYDKVEGKFGSAADATVQSTGDRATRVEAPQPWEARIGARFYKKRPRPLNDDGTPAPAPRGLDPLRDELFDIEIDLEYSHDSQFKTLGVSFDRGNLPRINVDGIERELPPDASVNHNWKDSFGVRLGGDVNVIPQRLALRAGAWFQSAFVDARDMHLDFIGAQRLGLTAGGTVRLGPADIQVGYGHIFFKTLDNGGQGTIRATGTGKSTDNIEGRSDYAVNGGKIKAKADIVSLGVVVRWP